ncbi:MAG: enoyl-CoA hydratase-related protein [Pseudomonadota bacterium]|nr:enoyl-CoA hydratase-related protein [Pseudomonadota bacterium]MEC9392053.1 enoyl-CoA hydratase-related protein [Pseudomonadota bacterium]MEC9459518.1 enoyl-CoA hydratase-related protein [Pseudomonadota bacterium]MED5436528.1 enoyl-CoA hydratase-related protein [Pseudomonadota bacterium]
MTNLPKTKSVVLEKDEECLRIWFNTPENRNALSEEVIEDLEKTVEAVNNDLSIRTIILRGKGGVFCAGADLKGFRSNFQSGNKDIKEISLQNQKMGRLLDNLNQISQTIIVLIEGAAIAGGMGFACIGDITVSTSDAQFSLTETSIGIPPAQIAPFVVQRIGFSKARQLMLTGSRFKGVEAFEMGLVHVLVDEEGELEKKAIEIRKSIRRCAPGANSATKAILFATQYAKREDLIGFAGDKFAECMLSDEAQEGVASFIEKRKPNWADEE